MSLNKTKENMNDLLLWGGSILFLLFIVDYLFYNRFILTDLNSLSFRYFFNPLYNFHKIQFLRFLLVGLIFGYAWYIPNFTIIKVYKPNDRYYFVASAITVNTLFILGFSPFEFYNVFVYPFIMVSLIFFNAIAASFIHKKQLISDDSIFGINTYRKDNGIDFKIKVPNKFPLSIFKPHKIEILHIPSPEYHFWIDGGTGAGKSASFFKTFLYEGAKMGKCGLLFDYNGNPFDPGSPIQTRTVLRGLMDAPESVKTQFKMINFSDLRKTNRVNIFSEKYISGRSDIKETVTVLMKNLEKEWKVKTDFWANNAISYIEAITYMFFKNMPEYCTLPHIISAGLYNHEAVLEWCDTDEEVANISRPIFTAYKNKAEGQIAGAISSAQLPISKLDFKELFWVMSKDETSLDVTNPLNPIFLCLCNSPTQTTVLAPPIATITTTSMRMMNQPGKMPAVFSFDEFPQVNLTGIPDFVNLVRKYNVSCAFGLQDFTQAITNYGKDFAAAMRNSIGNQFYGKTSSLETAKMVCDVFGDEKKVDISYNENQGLISSSEKLQKDKIFQPRHIIGQKIGQFKGWMASGEPTFFDCRFVPYLEEHLEPEIPYFAIDKNISSGDPEIDRRFINRMASNNYIKINKDVANILSPYLPKNAQTFNNSDTSVNDDL